MRTICQLINEVANPQTRKTRISNSIFTSEVITHKEGREAQQLGGFTCTEGRPSSDRTVKFGVELGTGFMA